MLLQMAVHNIPLYINVYIHFYLLMAVICWLALGCFMFLVFVISTAMNIGVNVCFQIWFVFPDFYLGVELLDYTVALFVDF